MRYSLILFYCFFNLPAQGQEKVNTFHVIDSLSGKAIPAVSITILRAKLTISTEKDGIFSIPGDLTTMRDTVVIDAQGYLQYRILLHIMHRMDSLRLIRIPHRAVVKVAVSKEELQLNKFERTRVAYYAGLHTETAAFDYLQLAQHFFLPKPGARLMKVNLSRLAFRLNYFRQEDAVGMESTKFRIRIYEADKTTDGPGADLCKEVIEIKNKDNGYLTINLSDYNIIIPGKSFFVAIEWMRDFTNQGYVVLQDKSGQNIQSVNYRPAIGISPVKGSKLRIWGLNLKRQWKPYTYFSPDFTDLALSVTVEQ